MGEKFRFAGTVVRVEPDGFGIIRFDEPVGPSANTFGIFSNSTGTVVRFDDIKAGVHVTGMAEANERDLAAVKTVVVDAGS